MKNCRKISVVILILLLMTSLKGCNQSKSKADKQLSVGLIQYVQHPALDEAKEGFKKELSNENIQIIEQNAQGEITNINAMANKLLKDDVDLIFAISTPVAQTVKNIESEVPIVFTAVTDPVNSDLVDSWESSGNNLTGTSDEAPIREQLELFKKIDPDIETIGILYSTNEINSKIQVDKIKELSKELNLKIECLGISDINELPKATDSLIAKVDAIYTPADNMIASGINIISKKAIEAQMISIGAESAHVDGGILASKGINYFDLGQQSARMAKKILLEGYKTEDLAIEKSENIELDFNKNTLDKLGLDPNLFN